MRISWSRRAFQSFGTSFLAYSAVTMSVAPPSSTGLLSSCSAASPRSFGKLEPMALSVNFPVFRLYMEDDGTFPNNPIYPLILFQNAYHETEEAARQAIVNAGWTSPWAWGVFPYHHYHSTAWELLVCVQGSALLQLGGETGPQVQVQTGDLMLIPPGFAHKQLKSYNGFTLLGSYPPDSGHVDVLRGKPTLDQRDNIRQCLAPKSEPLSGMDLSRLYK